MDSLVLLQLSILYLVYYHLDQHNENHKLHNLLIGVNNNDYDINNNDDINNDNDGNKDNNVNNITNDDDDVNTLYHKRK